MELADLIQKAAEREGSHVKLAAKLSVTQQRVSEWKHGHRPCPIETQARIALIAGEDAPAWVWKVVSERLGKAVTHVLALGAAVTLVCGLAGGAGRAEAASATAPNV